MFQYFSNIRDKSHIKQLVRFVYNQHFKRGEINIATVDVVDETAGAGDNNIDPFF